MVTFFLDAVDKLTRIHNLNLLEDHNLSPLVTFYFTCIFPYHSSFYVSNQMVLLINEDVKALAFECDVAVYTKSKQPFVFRRLEFMS